MYAFEGVDPSNKDQPDNISFRRSPVVAGACIIGKALSDKGYFIIRNDIQLQYFLIPVGQNDDPVYGSGNLVKTPL